MKFNEFSLNLRDPHLFKFRVYEIGEYFEVENVWFGQILGNIRLRQKSASGPSINYVPF